MIQQIGIIKSAGFGLRDFRDGNPGFWLDIEFPEDSTGVLFVWEWDKTKEIFRREKIENVCNLKGRRCLVESRHGYAGERMTFLHLLNKSQIFVEDLPKEDEGKV